MKADELDDGRGVAAIFAGIEWERDRVGRWHCRIGGISVGFVGQDGPGWWTRTCFLDLNVRDTRGDRYPGREAAMRAVEARVLEFRGGGLALTIMSELFAEAEVEAEAAVSQWLALT